MAEDQRLKERSVTSVPKELQVSCWGCGLRLVLESYSPVFKCGWCGAVTQRDQIVKKDSWFFSFWRRARDRLFTTVLLIFIIFIISGGIWAIYPIIFATSKITGVFHLTIAAILSISTISSLCMAAFRSPGPPPNIIWGSYPSIGKDGLQDYTLCMYCERPKPPRAHHCRSCRTCVMDMDHHCPFIGNCVGAANHLSFILFLISVIISCTYTIIMSVYCGRQVWPPIKLNLFDLSSNPNSITVTKMVQSVLSSLASSLLELSTQGLLLMYLAFASFSVEVGIALLLWQQMSFIYEGSTYLSSISSSSAQNNVGGYGERGWKNVVRFFGCPYAVSRLFWFLGFGNSGKLIADGESGSKTL